VHLLLGLLLCWIVPGLVLVEILDRLHRRRSRSARSLFARHDLGASHPPLVGHLDGLPVHNRYNLRFLLHHRLVGDVRMLFQGNHNDRFVELTTSLKRSNATCMRHVVPWEKQHMHGHSYSNANKCRSTRGGGGRGAGETRLNRTYTLKDFFFVQDNYRTGCLLCACVYVLCAPPPPSLQPLPKPLTADQRNCFGISGLSSVMEIRGAGAGLTLTSLAEGSCLNT